MSDQKSRPIWIALEDLFIVLSVFALWPRILHWEGAIWEYVQYAAVVGLVWILIRRMGRYKQKD